MANRVRCDARGMQWAALLAAAAIAVWAAGCDDGGGDGSETRSVTVTYGATSVDVDLGTLDAVDLGDGEGTVWVGLSDVVEDADLGAELSTLEFDFEASDGFHPGDSDNCTDFVPVAGADLSNGYISAATGDLSWDESLGFPGCLRVNEVVTIVASDPS